MNACSSVSTDGEGEPGSMRKARSTRAISVSDIALWARRVSKASSRTAGKPAGSIAAMSQPEPLT